MTSLERIIQTYEAVSDYQITHAEAMEIIAGMFSDLSSAVMFGFAVWMMGMVGALTAKGVVANPGRHSEKGLEASTSYWDLNNTDMPYYNEILRNPEYYLEAKGVGGEITWMTPDEYMQKAAQIHGVPTSREYDVVMPSLVKKYANDMRSGSKLPVPVLDFDVGTQEGRHRVVAAQWLGAGKIPVLVVTRSGGE